MIVKPDSSPTTPLTELNFDIAPSTWRVSPTAVFPAEADVMVLMNPERVPVI
jgi:hypothetical protein